MKPTIIAVITGSIIVVLVAGTLSYQQIYNQNCIKEGNYVTGFLKCTGVYCDFGIPDGAVGVSIPKGSSDPEKQINVRPKTITIVLGKNNTVMWYNTDRDPSTIIADDGSWTTGLIPSCNSATVTFNKTGIYEYHGELHPWKKGKIIVLEEKENES